MAPTERNKYDYYGNLILESEADLYGPPGELAFPLPREGQPFPARYLRRSARARRPPPRQLLAQPPLSLPQVPRSVPQEKPQLKDVPEGELSSEERKRQILSGRQRPKRGALAAPEREAPLAKPPKRARTAYAAVEGEKTQIPQHEPRKNPIARLKVPAAVRRGPQLPIPHRVRALKNEAALATRQLPPRRPGPTKAHLQSQVPSQPPKVGADAAHETAMPPTPAIDRKNRCSNKSSGCLPEAGRRPAT